MPTRSSSADSFTRSRKRGNRRGVSYSRPVSDNAINRDRQQLKSFIIDLIFCMLLPPYGIYRVWTRQNLLLPARVVYSVVAAVCMYIMFSFMLPTLRPTPQSVPLSASSAVEVYSFSD
ncbi:MAG: hypothetical protein K5663_02595 [Clostridiales bacterium]|nr:hypothetical protein [Clostridiales bacterium]